MNLSKAKPGDIVLVDKDRVQGEDNSFAAYLIHPAVYPKWNEGERQVYVKPIPSWATWHLVSVSDIIGLYPYKTGKRPGKIERLIREFDPENDIPGGVTKVG